VPRVLLVDDDLAEISAVKRVLARTGHQAVLATSAADALAAVGRTPPAVLVVASSCEAGEALRRLAEDGAASGIPFVVLGESPAAPPGAAQVARPVDPAVLAERLTAALGTPAPAPERAAPPAPAAAPSRRTTAAESTAGAAPLSDRRAAADALRARAEELRRGAAAPAPAPAPDPTPAPEALPSTDWWGEGDPGTSPAVDPGAAADAALAELATPIPGGIPALDLDTDPGLEAILRRAEEAEARARRPGGGTNGDAARAAQADAEARRAEQEARLAAEAQAEAARLAEERRRAQAKAQADAARAEERRRAQAKAQAEAARAEERRRAQAKAEAEAARAEEERRRAQAKAEAEAARAEEERRRAQAEAEIEAARADEERRRAQAEAEIETARAAERRRAEEEAAARAAQAEAEIEAARAAEEQLRAEREARERADAELARVRRELEEERRAAEVRAREAAEADEEKLRAAIRSARDEMEALRRQSGAEEEQLRAAIQSARAEMESLRRRSEEDARRRAEAEAEVARLAREAERKAADASRPPPLEVPVYRPPAEDPAPDPAQETARRRVAALRGRAAPEPAAPAAPAAPPEPPRAPVRAPPPELRSGTLAELPMPRLLALAARAELSGRIDLEGEATRSLFFDTGRVVGATSSAPAERVEEVALRLGLVTRDQHRLVAASAAPLATRRAAVLLLERGFLKPNELGPLVRRRTEEVVFGAFGDAGARFRWAAAEVPPDESTALERAALQLAVEGVRRRWLAPEVDAVLGGDATLVAPVPTGPGAADLGLSAEERRVLALADGLRTLDELVAASPLDPLSTRQALAALVLVGTLVVRTFQGGRPAAAASAAIDLARVRDKLDQVRRADYFAVLGVGRLCTPHEVRDAYERLRAEFDPRRFQGVREDGLEERLEEIQRVVADARDVLADDRLRAEYLRGLGE
jgi:hypothetical protein